MSRTWFNTHPAIRFSRSFRHPRTFRCNRTRCGGGTCRNRRRHIHHCWSRLGHKSFLFFLISNPQLIKLRFLVQQMELKWRNYLWSICLRVGVWCQCNGFEILESRSLLPNNQLKANLWVRETCLLVGPRPLIIILITASLSFQTYNIALESEFFVLDGMWSMFVGMTLVCFTGIVLCMFDLAIADGFSRSSLLVHLCSVRNEILQSPNPRE